MCDIGGVLSFLRTPRWLEHNGAASAIDSFEIGRKCHSPARAGRRVASRNGQHHQVGVVFAWDLAGLRWCAKQGPGGN